MAQAKQQDGAPPFAAVLAAAAAAPDPQALPADEEGKAPVFSLGRVYCTSSSALAAEWCAKLCVSSHHRDAVRFDKGEQIEKSLVFIWDSEALQLHGVFRVDSSAPQLPLSEVPGNRSQQLRLRPQYHFPVTLGFNEVSDILIPEKDHSGRETDFFKNSFASRGSRKVWDLFAAKLREYKALAAAGGGGDAAAAAAAAGSAAPADAAGAQPAVSA